MKTYRVFVTRYYIATDFFDVKASTEKVAKKAAEKAAERLRPDARAEATDNGWIADEPVKIERLGYCFAPFEVKLVYETLGASIYHDIDC